DRTTNLVDFPGKITETITVHNENTAKEQTVARKFDYDHAGRLLKTWHSVNGGDRVLLAKNDYNELGQAVGKHLHNTDPQGADDEGRNFHQSIDYRYNIRGWLERINQVNDPGSDDLFALLLNYESPGATGSAVQF